MSLTGYCNSAYIKNRFYSIYRFGVVIFFFLVLFLILQKTVENMSKSILTKNNKSSLRKQKLSLRLILQYSSAIPVLFDFFLILRQNLFKMRRKFLNAILAEPRSRTTWALRLLSQNDNRKFYECLLSIAEIVNGV